MSAPPPGILPIYLRSAMVEQYGLVDYNGKPVVYKKISKTLILDDIQRQGVYNDFSEIKAKLQAIPMEELLFIHDPDGKYEGANFLICSNDEIIQQRLQEAEAIERAQREEQEAREAEERRKKEEEEKLLIYVEKDFAPRPWPSLGSEPEVDQLTVKRNRPLITHRLSRRRRDFGAAVELIDQEAPDKAVDLRKQIVTNFDLRRIELDIGLQASHGRADASTQSSWRRLVHKGVQYAPASLGEAAAQQQLHSHTLSAFLRRALPLAELALQQNETLNLCRDELAALEDEELSVGHKAENSVRDLHTLSDMVFSKFRQITCVDWLPGSTTSLAMSCAGHLTFDQRVEQSGRVPRAHILIWTLADLMTPQLVLEAPEDVLCFRFNPHRPDIIIAGLSNGQIALWDLTEVRAQLREREARRSQQQGKDGSASTPAGAEESKADPTSPAAGAGAGAGASGPGSAPSGGADDEGEDKLGPHKPIPPLLLSVIEKGHPRGVVDIEWLPRHVDITRRGEVLKSEAAYSQQLVTIAADGHAMFWDLRNVVHERKGASPSVFAGLALGSAAAVAAAAAAAAQAAALAALAAAQAEAAGLSPAAAQAAAAASQGGQGGQGKEDEEKNPKWLPFLSLPLVRPQDNEELAPVRLCVSDSSQFLVVTEDGELVVCDWGASKKDDDDESKSAKGLKQPVRQVCRAHVLPATALQRSPHFPDLFLTVGDWSFHIWKLSLETPIFSSPFAEESVTCGCWSPTRPGVVVISCADGTVHLWDLLDQSHRPTAVQSVTSNSISAIKFCQPSTSVQYLAVGDSQGDLHILDIPRNFRRKVPGEEDLMQAFYRRELDRVQYNRSKMPLPPPAPPAPPAPSATAAGAAAQAGGAAPPAASGKDKDDEKSDGGVDEKAEAEYQKLLTKFKQDLGIVDDKSK